MLAFVLNKNGDPLMPCKPQRARKLLKGGKAKVIKRTPFIIKLLHGSSGHKQPIVAGMDTGSKIVGVAAASGSNVLYQSEVKLRVDVSRKMQQRAVYRHVRRGRKCRYRPARWLNRASMRKKGRLAPSIKSKLDGHLREKEFVEAILPITNWKVETATFDIHKITNPDVAYYQTGPQQGYYNLKSYILHRDGYKCQSEQKRKHSEKLHVHHIVFRSNGGTNSKDNLITLCSDCHKALHSGEFQIKGKSSKTKHATESGIVQGALRRSGWKFEETFGYITKHHREQILHLPKSHCNDAIAICCEPGEIVRPSPITYYKVHVSRGDFRQTNGKRSEKKIPTGKLFGLRKFDMIETPKGIGFVKGKRSTGQFVLMDIHGAVISTSVSVKKNCTRLSARNSTLIMGEATPHLNL